MTANFIADKIVMDGLTYDAEARMENKYAVAERLDI